MRAFFRPATLLAIVALGACGSPTMHVGDDASAHDDVDAATTDTSAAAVLSGTLVGGTGPTPGAILGVRYRTPTQAGYTDATGSFHYEAGETVTFSVADVDFNPTPGRAMVSPWQLATAGTCGPSEELTSLLVLLYSLDTDGDPSNGTQISEAPQGTTQRSFASLSDADILALVQQLGGHGMPPDGGAPDGGLGPLIDGNEAVVEFINQMDGETWQQIGLDTFLGTTGEQRSQGVTTDGTHYIFSWQVGFQETDTTSSYDVTLQNDFAIPVQLVAEGIDHFGDCDDAGGDIYVGSEDSAHYEHPTISEFDSSLNFVQSFALSTTEMTAGCPWVAVDAANAHLLVANAQNSTQLFVHDMTTGVLVSTILLSRIVDGIQGAKLFEGSLYASTHDAVSGIYKIDLATGVVTPLWAFDFTDGAEEEGCVFLAQPDGSTFHTLNVNAGRTGTEFRHHQRTREPLRKSVCP